MIVLNPLEWVVSHLKSASSSTGSAAHTVMRREEDPRLLVSSIRRIHVADLAAALDRGFEDFKAARTDVMFLCLIYPLIGLVLGRLAYGHERLALVFPLVSGFALLGPVAGTWLYEMSRERERDGEVSWADAFGVLRSPRFGAIATFSVASLIMFGFWLASAEWLYGVTLGPEPPVSVVQFVNDVFTTQPGWIMIGAGMAIGFVFALFMLAISIVTIPLLLDRDVGLDTAIVTSISVMLANPIPIATWGLIIAAGLVLGSLPFLAGLIVIVPILSHATWHLYRLVIPR